MLGVVGHGYGLVDEQHGDAILDAVDAAQPRVVKQFVIADQQKWPAVLRTSQDAEQFLVKHESDQPG